MKFIINLKKLSNLHVFSRFFFHMIIYKKKQLKNKYSINARI